MNLPSLIVGELSQSISYGRKTKAKRNQEMKVSGYKISNNIHLHTINNQRKDFLLRSCIKCEIISDMVRNYRRNLLQLLPILVYFTFAMHFSGHICIIYLSMCYCRLKKLFRLVTSFPRSLLYLFYVQFQRILEFCMKIGFFSYLQFSFYKTKQFFLSLF